MSEHGNAEGLSPLQQPLARQKIEIFEDESADTEGEGEEEEETPRRATKQKRVITRTRRPVQKITQ